MLPPSDPPRTPDPGERQRHYPPDWKTATAASHRPPEFVIIGAQRAGTSSLFAYLQAHPDVAPSWRKEVHFFDRYHELGPSYYLAHFPPRPASRLAGEATPYYLFHPQVPERMHALLPAAKLIVLLRNPVDRAYSHYQLERQRGEEPLTFEEALHAEAERLAADPDPVGPAWRRHSYLRRGHYAEQLERWVRVYPRSQMHIIKSEYLYAQPAHALHQVEAWLGLASWTPPDLQPRNARTYDPLAPALRAELAQHFAAPNQRLYELLGQDLGW